MYRRIICLKFVLISIIVAIMIPLYNYNSILAAELVQNKKMEAIINKQLEIKRFQVDIALEIAAFSGNRSEFEFTYFYQEPDKIYIETEDFVLLPKEALKTLQPNFFHLSRYDYRYLDVKNGLQRFELIPLDTQGRYRLIIWFDFETSVVKFSEVFFRIEDYQEEFAVQIDYQQIEGYSLPVYVKGRLAIPTRFGMGGEIKEFQQGSFNLVLDNYQVNLSFSEKINKKLKSYN